MRLLTVVTAMLLALPQCVQAEEQTNIDDIVNSSQKFLALLDSEQRSKVAYKFDDQKQRTRWSNLPVGFIPRGGISLKQLDAAQREAVMKLLATVLSAKGLEKVEQIRAADEDFQANGSKRGPGGGHRPSGLPLDHNGNLQPHPSGLRPSGEMFGGNLYFISFLGEPSSKHPWMLQFGGHHLALNITFSGDKGTLAPTLTGAQPATFKLNGKTIRPLGNESDKALALVRTLTDEQHKEAILNYSVPDLVLGPRDDVKIAPEGMSASHLNSVQQTMLLDLIHEWIGIMNDAYATTRMAQIRKELKETWFAWSGSTSGETGHNITAYYRIQGPHLIIEYAPQRDEPDNHIHTIYRDPTNDYGKAITKL